MVCGWNRIGLVPCGSLEQSDAGELDELGLEQVLRDPGLRPVAQTRTKTGLICAWVSPARERGWSAAGA